MISNNETQAFITFSPPPIPGCNTWLYRNRKGMSRSKDFISYAKDPTPRQYILEDPEAHFEKQTPLYRKLTNLLCSFYASHGLIYAKQVTMGLLCGGYCREETNRTLNQIEHDGFFSSLYRHMKTKLYRVTTWFLLPEIRQKLVKILPALILLPIVNLTHNLDLFNRKINLQDNHQHSVIVSGIRGEGARHKKESTPWYQFTCNIAEKIESKIEKEREMNENVSPIPQSIRDVTDDLRLTKKGQIELTIFPDEAVNQIARGLEHVGNLRDKFGWFCKQCHAYCRENSLTLNWKKKSELYDTYKINPSSPTVFPNDVDESNNRIKAEHAAAARAAREAKDTRPSAAQQEELRAKGVSHPSMQYQSLDENTQSSQSIEADIQRYRKAMRDELKRPQDHHRDNKIQAWGNLVTALEEKRARAILREQGMSGHRRTSAQIMDELNRYQEMVDKQKITLKDNPMLPHLLIIAAKSMQALQNDYVEAQRFENQSDAKPTSQHAQTNQRYVFAEEITKPLLQGHSPISSSTPEIQKIEVVDVSTNEHRIISEIETPWGFDDSGPWEEI